MSENLFKDFEKVSSKQWKQQIQYELKGADYNDTLVWESLEGIKVKPFYHNDDEFSNLNINKKTIGFEIGQTIYVHDVQKSVIRAKSLINRGAETLIFTFQDPETDIKTILKEINNDTITYYFKTEFLSEKFTRQISDYLSQNTSTKIHLLYDPIGQLTSDGNWYFNLKEDFEILNSFAKNYPNLSFVNISGKIYQQAGANIIQQVAYILAHCNEYFNRIQDLKNTIIIEITVGSNYFFEIAKLRSIRLLFDLIAKEYNTEIDCKILASPSKRNKTLYDYNVNMLRTTTECMSAILGGADVVTNLSYDNLYHKDNEFGDRIARNQLLILKKESYFDKVQNISDGTYYINSLTQQIAEKALQLFKEIESNDGLITQLIEGNIQRKITDAAQKEQDLFDTGKEILLGTNKYPNPNDKMKDELELYPFVKTKPRKTLITPIIEKRLAENVEKERLNSEN